MVRETRHLWVGNLPDNIREDRIREHFKRYGRVQSVKLLPRSTKEETGENAMACTVAFMDIKSASKAHTAEHKIDDRTLTTEYYEPAAIPSAASPQNTPSSYSTSPGSTRFPNGYGSTEEHGNFNDRFYDRPNSRVAEGEFIRRTGYHDNGRGRNRDRGYRNGPYNNVIDRTHRQLNNTWTYDSSATRYNNSQTNETGYSSAPSSESNERRPSDAQSTKKKKSRSGSRSPSPSGSTSSRSPSRSRSRSSSSSSSSTTSRATSSTGSPKSRRLASSINSTHQPVVHSEDRRPLAICVRNLPLRSSDTSLKDGLFHEYKKHGKVTWVKVVGQSSDRQAIVCFKKPEDVEKALEVSYDKLFFGCKIEVAPYQGYDVVEDNDLRPYEAEIDEFHPKATRTLFIGNLEKDVTASDLRKHFDQFGEIIEIDIKKQGAVGSYAFCQFSDIISVVKAIRTMDGEHLGNNRIKLGFGKSMPTNCVWVDGIVESVNEKYLMMQFDPFGSITQVNVDREKGQALIFYEQQVNAQAAVQKMRGATLRGRKIQVDFASRECQEAFYEHLEKQGHVLERPSGFEERRDSTTTVAAATTRTFEAATLNNTTNRFSRYDTPTRPRTSSYSSRSSAATSACNTNAVPSPGTPGSVTPRGSSSRSRLARFSEYYDQSGTEYGDRHFRSYDEYSQGSAASHEDTYDHEYGYNHDSPSHLEPVDSRTIQNATGDHPPVPFAQPDNRNLHKERLHILEQLEECPSSGDESISPKKRLKLDHIENTMTSDVIVEANRDHRKVMEVRRLSDASIKHHSRRPSIDSKHSREVVHDRGSYLPHAVCKRRKTASSDSGSRVHHYDHSGSESVGGSRPGTPLCDERPEHFTPSEPRRIPREREGPLTLPLPRFAAQVMNRGSVSVAGIKGQKETILSSPPPAVTSPRISNPKPPSPAQVPPPASPPPRPPSLSSNSSDSDVAPPSPSLDERIKSLEEKYEKWSGSRALSAAGGDALAKLDATRERFRFRHKLLDLDLKEVQPSEIVKSVMAKRSVFDEDSKRLENVGEKYEPREFNFFPRSTLSVQTSIPTTPLSAPPLLKTSSCTTQLLSPRSAGANVIPAKGLQYPFPSHPPIQPPLPNTPTTTTTTLLTTASASTTNRGGHGDNRLKPCANAPSDNRTPSKVSVNRSITSSVVVSNLTQIKTSDNKNSVNIPTTNPSDPTSATQANTGATDANSKHCKGVRDVKSGDRVCERITNRRDSVSSASPKSETKSRRNSDCAGRKGDESDRQSENSDSSLGDYKKDRARSEERRKEQRLENERLEKERMEKERQEKERQEKDRLEKERLEKEKAEKEERERIEKERLERERIERERKREKEERERKEREERERKEREERERREREEQLERERIEKERKERERREREEREKREREEREKREREERERERREREEREKERREKEEKERREREEQEKKEREERERREREEEERLERERLEKERKRDKDEERKHKDDNHDKRRDDHSRHRENHSENKHKENTTETTKNDNKHNAKEEKIKDNHELSRKDSHESRSHESKSKHHSERDSDKRKESTKENSLFDKCKNTPNELQETKNRQFVESRHLSIDSEKSRQHDINNKMDPTRRKERNNSLSSNIGLKRRMSSHENMENSDEAKRMKLSQEHRKLSERRDSKDDKSKSKHKNSTSKSHDDKVRVEKNTNDEKRKDRERDKEERHKNKLHKLEKQKLKNKSRDKESPTTPKSPAKELSDKDFLARLDLHATIDVEKQKQQRKEMKEKRKQETAAEMEERKENNAKDDRRMDERKKDKNSTSEKKNREDPKSSDERKTQKKERIRKSTHNSSDNTDSDEPKKHSIFDIVDDEPAYISMYDKVKARSCKNMQKQEEEKQKEKIKAKFSQLKQSRAKREEKKRSTSWDEDSDSDRERHEKCDVKRRGNKMLIASSDEEDLCNRKPRKKHEIYDSDSDRVRQIKLEQTETSDDDRIRSKSLLHRKGSKSRIVTSDTSDDEFKKLQNKIKSEIFSDNDIDHGGYPEEKVYKKVEYEDKLIKKERKNSKHMDSLEQINAQIFGDSNSPIMDMKVEKYNRHSFGENSSADENMEVKKEKSEMRKKHKKKQKRQKNSVSSEESCKLESVVDMLQSDEKSKHDKKKQHSKKDKKKDKNKDEDKLRDKSKKSKKNKSDSKSDLKRDGKMENIFGSLSEDSDALKEPEPIEHTHKQNSFMDCFSDENIQMRPYASDSDSISQEKETSYKEDTKDTYKEEKETFKIDEKARNLKEEHRKRKEKRRREKERRIREEMHNENSMDYADMGKQLEANIKDDTIEEATEETKVKVEGGETVTESTEDSFRFLEENESQDYKKEDRREIKEKKKKRKKSKEEKQNRHHHHHHHDKNKLKSPEFKKEVSLEEVKVEVDPEEKPNQSLPNILDLPSPPLIKTSPKIDFAVSPASREPLLSPIPKTPSSSKDKKRDKFIPGFGSEIDEKIHESAIKSISEFDTPKTEAVKPIEEEVLKPEKVTENIEEKPRVVISQEETEDAVAALLGESFGGDQYEDSYSEEVLNQNSEQSGSLPEEAIQQDDEEMRQAVQSLNSGDLEIKPDTPQSEHELQIDTDTDEPDELSSGIKFDRPPRTPDMLDLSQPPKTPDITTYYHRNEETVKGAPPPATILIKTTPNIGSPPSLTPLKPQNAALLEAKKILEQEPPKTNSLSVPLLPEQPRSVISQSWSLPEKKEVVPKLEPPVIKVEDKTMTTTIQTSVVAIVSQGHTKITMASPRTYTTAPIVKISESTFPPLAIIAKQEPTPPPKPSDLSPKLINLQTNVKTSSPSLMHNLPARPPPYQVSLQQQQKQMTSQESTTSVPARVSAPNFSLSRLPITPIMVSKPLQPTTVVLPQPKTAHNIIEPPKLVPTNDSRQDRSRMVCQTATIASYVQTQPRMIVQTNLSLQRGLPPQGLLVPAKQLPSNSYNYLTQPPYNLQTVVKDGPNVAEKPSRSPPMSSVVSEPPKVLPTSVPATYSQTVSLPVTTGTHVTLAQAHKIILSTHSNVHPPTTLVNTSKPFMPVIQETPKLINLSTSNVELQKCVIFTQTKPSVSPPTVALQQDKDAESSSKQESEDGLKVAKDVPRSCASSPVIVSTHKDTPIKPEGVKLETIKKEEDSKPLAIEKVTEELNLTLKKESEEPTTEEKSEMKEPEKQSQVDLKIKTDTTKEADVAKQDNENTSVIKETDKFDEEKADTESIVSDISKERSSAEILTKDDALDSKEDSDYWSAKEVNIDSVIKKVDALCSGDEISDRSSEGGKDEWYDNESKNEGDAKNDSKEDLGDKDEASPNSSKIDHSEGDLDVSEEKEVSPRGRRGGRTRGRKTRGVERGSGVQTRRGKVATPAKRGGRGGRPKNERRITKSESEACADVYEFRDDSDENNANKDRPRLILTIKSPAIASAGGVTSQTTIVKEIPKETALPQTPPTKPPVEPKEEFASPVTNTRKSRRLQEKDISRNTVDDTIEDVVRNTAVVTRSSTAAAQNQGGGPRRSTRQVATKVQQDTPRKSPRGGRKKDRRASETTDDSSEEKSLKNEPVTAKQEDPAKEIEKPKVEENKVEPLKEKPHEGLKAAVLRRVKGEMSQEPMTLIDPVTGLLTPMRECEEGRYIPVPGAPNIHNELRSNAQQQPIRVQQPNEPQQQQSVITISQQSAAPKQQKPQSLKAHVLSSQAAQAVVSQQPPKSLGSCQPAQQPLYISKPNVPINQSLNVNVSLANYIPTHLSPRTSVPLNITKPVHNIPVQSKPPPLSPNQMIALANHQKQQILQQVKPQQAMVPKAHMGSSQIINTQLAHVNKHPQPQVMKQVVVNKAQIPMKNPLHAQQILTGAVASPPLKQPQPNATRIVQGPPSKGSMEPPKIENSTLASCVLVPRPNVSPQGQPRHVLQAGLPSYEANMHGDRSVYNRSRSPPPAHQNSPSPQGEAMAHFPPGSVPLRPPHDLPPAHYMHHPSHVMYHQYLRQSYHIQPRTITGGLEKTGDGQEGEEAPITSPPLELRRPGSVGLALTGRTGAVPHSLQSPHDRATDSPQVGQMYNVHTARMQHYHPAAGRYYEQTAEPPPAHRQLPSHGSLAALGSDRPLGHMVPLGTPDRPLSSHMTPDRPLSSHSALASHIGGLGTPDRPITTHLPPDRPLSSHGLALGAGLGAAGNLMGAVARHIGADAPASQRGLQAATPPHASQVPPQAESLLMLLKQYPCMWQGLLALKNDQAAVQMYFVSGNDAVAKCSLPKNTDGSTPPLRIFQRMRLEPPQVEGVARKMQMENEHCMLLALPCGHDHMDVLKQSTNLTNGFITYLQQKQAAGIVNVAAPGTTQPPAYVVHIFPSCDFVNENLRRIAPSLLERVADIAHLLIVITTV